jgi:hypothetical protein
MGCLSGKPSSQRLRPISVPYKASRLGSPQRGAFKFVVEPHTSAASPEVLIANAEVFENTASLVDGVAADLNAARDEAGRLARELEDR